MTVLLWGVAVAGSLIVGALAASWLPEWERVAAAVSVFAAGLLIAAVAFELVPDARTNAGAAVTALGVVAGAVLFAAADWWLALRQDTASLRRECHARAAGRPPPDAGPASDEDAKKANTGRSIALGSLVDGIPESAALGVAIVEGAVGLALLAGILIANVAEAFGGSTPLIGSGKSRAYAVGLFGGIGFALVVALSLGASTLPALGHGATGFCEAVAAGAVLATVSIAIIPHAFAAVSRLSAIVLVLGFLAGYLLA